MDEVADYVIVGAGSAGCVLAARLTEDPKIRVILLEAGGDDRPTRNLRQFSSNVNIHLPAGFTTVMNDPIVNWGYRSDPEPGVNGRRFMLARGRVLGGSSSINGMTYIRGLPQDYDQWRQLGCAGWGWESMLPYFRRAEHQKRGGDLFHGERGPMHVTDAPFRHPVSEIVRRAFVEAGVPATEDLNGAMPEGVTYAQACIHRGRRQSMAVAYLHPAMRRPNLSVMTNAFSTNIVFEGKRAIGITYLRGGKLNVARAGREVILTAGAIGSPHLLQLSGVGPGAMLASHGITPIVDNPSVGENLQDHYSAMLRARLKPGTASLNQASRGMGLAVQIARWVLWRDGLLAAGASQLTAFAKTNPAYDLPDAQYFSSPATVDFARSAAQGKMVLEQEPGITIGSYQMRPHARGRLAIISPDPAVHPSILCNYLTDPFDQQCMIGQLRLARKIMAQPALAHLLTALVMPEANEMSDADLLDYAKATGSTAYHQCGTCRMGDDAAAVVDLELRVRGAGQLRVVDASIMPSVISGNTNAAVVAIAEKAAAMIRDGGFRH